MIGVVVMASIMRHIQWIELTMFNYRTTIGLPKFVAQVIPIIALVSGSYPVRGCAVLPRGTGEPLSLRRARYSPIVAVHASFRPATTM